MVAVRRRSGRTRTVFRKPPSGFYPLQQNRQNTASALTEAIKSDSEAVTVQTNLELWSIPVKLVITNKNSNKNKAAELFECNIKKASLGLIPVLVFLLSIFAPRLLVNTVTQFKENPALLKSNTKVPGFRFQNVKMEQQVLKSIGTQNIINGHFYDAKSNRYSVFKATWKEGEGTINDLYHTPDACWIQQGYQGVDLDVPDCLDIQICGYRIPFQCRVLRQSINHSPEVVVWAAVVDGQWDQVKYLKPLYSDRQNQNLSASHWVNLVLIDVKNKWRYVVLRIMHPIKPNVPMELIRISKRVDTNFEIALKDLEGFLQLWLTCAP
jgi:hypothetical protein